MSARSRRHPGAAAGGLLGPGCCCWRAWLRQLTCCRALLLATAILLALESLGVFKHMLEWDYYTQFSYPLDSDVSFYVELLQRGERPPVQPLNEYKFRTMLEPTARLCDSRPDLVPLRLLLMVKSAVDHSERRSAIRDTWGGGGGSQPAVRTVFVLGTRAGEPGLQAAVQREAAEHGDILQADFYDTYFNNTLKTMTGLGWATDHCKDADHVLFVDDDMYVCVPNVLRLAGEVGGREAPVLAGYVFHSAPHRHRFSKWYVTLEEYPYHLWPPYCTAGAYLVSRTGLRLLFYTSRYTKHFRFDDIYIGLVARKAGIRPQHTDHIYFWEKPYDPEGYRDVIASHGYGQPEKLRRVWREQHALRHA